MDRVWLGDPSVPGSINRGHSGYEAWQLGWYYLPGTLVGVIISLGSAVVVHQSIYMWAFPHSNLSVVRLLMW